MRIVVLVSGSGTLLQALAADLAAGGTAAHIVAVGADRAGIGGLDIAAEAGLPSFVVRPRAHASRAEWDLALRDAVAGYEPDLVVSAGFMRILGSAFLERFQGRTINTHPALLPAFPGAHGVRDALRYGVKVTGSTIHIVDAGVDTGPIIHQVPVAVLPTDTEDTLHERIKVAERAGLIAVVRRLADRGWTVTGRNVTLL